MPSILTVPTGERGLWKFRLVVFTNSQLWELSMRRTTLFSIAATFLAWPGLAAADSGPKGTYIVVGSQACLYAKGFDIFNQANDDNIFGVSGNFHLVSTYNGDGTGTVSGTFVSIAVPPTLAFVRMHLTGAFNFLSPTAPFRTIASPRR